MGFLHNACFRSAFTPIRRPWSGSPFFTSWWRRSMSAISMSSNFLRHCSSQAVLKRRNHPTWQPWACVEPHQLVIQASTLSNFPMCYKPIHKRNYRFSTFWMHRTPESCETALDDFNMQCNHTTGTGSQNSRRPAYQNFVKQFSLLLHAKQISHSSRADWQIERIDCSSLHKITVAAKTKLWKQINTKSHEFIMQSLNHAASTSRHINWQSCNDLGPEPASVV